MTAPLSRTPVSRRRLLQSAGAWALVSPLLAGASAAAAQEMPAIPALTSFLAGRSPRRERLRLDLPTLADNGQAVPMRLTMAGPFAPGPTVRAIHLFSEVNPVPEMAVFEFPIPPPKVEIDSRVRLAGSQRVVAVAVMSDGALFAAVAEVIVTIAACLDGS
ncbi:MAG TPA: thiosulfate oxidation carrier protein SoxY [Casimicrobiaceae bacterium]|jgi:sulfur-oxidizing protein SoxY|nr:thiosulfate oxidation carrier protein SoxY [Casimicrobiaceae bacterium]